MSTLHQRIGKFLNTIEKHADNEDERKLATHWAQSYHRYLEDLGSFLDLSGLTEPNSCTAYR